MAGYLGSTPVPQATQHRESFTATSGQTTFATAGYTAGFVDVYLNGSHLSPADFVATNGSDVVLVSGAAADDVCDIISHSAFEVNAQTFTGTTTMDVVTATGVVTANGGAVFNEGSADVDFRVESNGNANMLFVDGGNDRVGVGTATPATMLHVHNASGNASAQLTSGTSGTSFINMGDTGDADAGQISYINNGDAMAFTAGAAERMRIDSTGAVTMPSQPAFLVHPASAQNNIATGSDITVVWGTERFDNNADFASNTFTAPVTGKYQINANLYLNQIDTASDYYEIQIVSSNKTYYHASDPGGLASDPVYWLMSLNQLIDMDASDTALIKFKQGTGTAQTDIAIHSFFSGYLVA